MQAVVLSKRCGRGFVQGQAKTPKKENYETEGVRGLRMYVKFEYDERKKDSKPESGSCQHLYTPAPIWLFLLAKVFSCV